MIDVYLIVERSGHKRLSLQGPDHSKEIVSRVDVLQIEKSSQRIMGSQNPDRYFVDDSLYEKLSGKPKSQTKYGFSLVKKQTREGVYHLGFVVYSANHKRVAWKFQETFDSNYDDFLKTWENYKFEYWEDETQIKVAFGENSVFQLQFDKIQYILSDDPKKLANDLFEANCR